jgi:hypothetical protein
MLDETDRLKDIKDKMIPGVITLKGFIGDDTRQLEDIVKEDDKKVINLGITHRQIADRMIYFREEGAKGLGLSLSVPPHFLVSVDSIRGGIPCPFSDPGIFPKTVITVKNVDLNKEISFTDLNIHLIYAHGFYQGKGALYRLEPEELKEVLEVG